MSTHWPALRLNGTGTSEVPERPVGGTTRSGQTLLVNSNVPAGPTLQTVVVYAVSSGATWSDGALGRLAGSTGASLQAASTAAAAIARTGAYFCNCFMNCSRRLMMMKALEAAAAEAIDVPGWTNTEPTGAPTT